MVPHAPLQAHGVAGDRRAGALIASDGAVDWLRVPEFNGEILFGALVDASAGGFWRLGPAHLTLGRQFYVENSAALVTTWEGDGWELDLTDVFAWPERDRPAAKEGHHALLRRLRCSRGKVSCASQFSPNRRLDPFPVFQSTSGARIASIGGASLRLWSNRPALAAGDSERFELREGESVWMALEFGRTGMIWSTETAQEALFMAAGHWQNWSRSLSYRGTRAAAAARSAMALRLLHSAGGAPVPALLPASERRRGPARLIETASVISALAICGDVAGAEEALDAVVADHRPDGDLCSLGFLAEALRVYADHGGAWKNEYADLLRLAASDAADRWREPDRGLWGVGPLARHTATAIMAWVALDRADRMLGGRPRKGNGRWRTERDRILITILRDGWSPRLQAFRGILGEDALDASALLLTVMNVVPGEDERIAATVDRLEEQLSIDGFLYRFRPFGEFEAPSAVATFWLAAARAKSGRSDAAQTLLARLESLAPLGLYAESADPRARVLAGAFPSAFAHGEHIRCLHAVAQSRPVDRLKLMIGEAERRLLGHAQPAWSSPES